MKSRPQHLLVTGLCLSAVCLTGCLSPNTRQVEFGCVLARAHLEKGVATYYEIEISRPTDVSAPPICLRLPNGRVIGRASFTYIALKKAGFEDFADPDHPQSSSYALTRYGASFAFFNGALVSMWLTQTSGAAVGIGREGGKQFYTLPLKQEEVERLFGRPEKTSDKHQWIGGS